MAEQLLTKCPHCGTTFRLSQQHLQIAGGAVRCGACYQVFHASEYIVKTAIVEEIVQPEPPPKPQAPLPDPLADFNIDDIDALEAYSEANLDLPNPDEDLFADDYHKKLVEGGDDHSLSFDDEARTTKKSSSKKTTGHSEDWAKQLLEELGESCDEEDDDGDEHFNPRKRSSSPQQSNTGFSSIQSGDDVFADIEPVKHAKKAVTAPPNTLRTPQKPKRLEEELSDSFKSLGLKGFSDDPFSIDDLENDEEKDTGDVDESWAKAMLEELEGEKRPPAKAKLDAYDFSLENDLEEEELPFASKPLSRNKDEALQKARERSHRASFGDPKSSDTGKSTDSKEGTLSSFGNDFFSEFDDNALELEDINLEDNTVGFNHLDDLPEPPQAKMSPADIAAKVRAHAAQLALEQAPRTNPFKTLLLLLGSLLLVSALLAQVAYFKFHELSRWPQLRPLYALACDKLGCTLPAQTDTSKIRGSNLVVRSHPSATNALSVDFMISNEAYFSQPFPIIEVTFEDINEALVASRGFLPTEYIKDPAIDPKHMPPNTPFHIGLEIVDPGPKAANYRLRYLPVPD